MTDINSRALVSLLIAALSVTAMLQFAPGATATVQFSEDWESDGFPGWTMTGVGATRDCVERQSGSCSLKFFPPCCHDTVTLSKAVNVPLTQTVTVYTHFRNSAEQGNVDSAVYINLGADVIRVHITHCGNSNVLAESTISNTDPLACGQGSYSPGVWNRLAVTLDPGSHTARVIVTDPQGNPRMNVEIPYNPSATTILGLSFDAIHHGNEPNTVWYDNLVVAEGGISPSPPPFSTPTSSSATTPRNVLVNPNFTVIGGNPVTVFFQYTVKAAACVAYQGCYTQSEWRVLQGGTVQNGAVSSPTGTLLSNGIAVNVGDNSTNHHAEAVPVIITGTAGTHLLKVAVRSDPTASEWMVNTTSITILGDVDADGDGVSDEVEAQLCGPTIAMTTINSLGGGAGVCVTQSNYSPPSTGMPPATVSIPYYTASGTDADNDDVPAYMVIYYANLTIDPSGGVKFGSYGHARTETLDTQDDNEDVPVEAEVCSTVATPSGVVRGADQDGDGFPSHVTVTSGYLCIDRTTQGPLTEIEPAGIIMEQPVDDNDNDAQVPAASYIEVNAIPVDADFSEDADGDGIAANYTIKYLDIKYDRRAPGIILSGMSYRDETTELDEDDSDPNEPINYNVVPLIDADGDNIPDASEPTICQLINRNYPEYMGSCNSTSTNYNPPPWYSMVLAPIP